MKAARPSRFGFGTAHFVLGFLACQLAALGPAPCALGAAAAGGGEQSFKLGETSAFGQAHDGFRRGQAAQTQDKPFAEVKAYPVFVSKKPIYGSVAFARTRDDADAGLRFYFALDESLGTGKGYDRLYFDSNRDLDLHNDTARLPRTAPPEGARLTYSSTKQQVIFDAVPVTFDFGPAGNRAVELMPRLTISVYDKKEYNQVTFVRPRVYEGDITVSGRPYRAVLGSDYVIGGRLDFPGTALVLTPKDRGDGIDWWGGDRLSAMHKVDGRFFTFSADPTGEKLTVSPYAGDLGIFEIGPGSRSLDKLAVAGSLEGRDRGVAVGGEVKDGSPKPARRCKIPVGDYLPNFIYIDFGRLRIEVSQNYHAEGKPRNRAGRPAVYGITIRKEKPFALDFSNAPDVMFACPTNGSRLKRGDTLEVKAVLVDPKLDIMIRGLEDTTRKQTNAPPGSPAGYQRNLSLDPKVLITRLNGEKVAEGVMPFG